MFSGSSTPAQPQPRQVNSVRASLCSRGEPPLSLYIVQSQDRSSAALTASPPESPAPASVPSQLSFASFLSPPNQAMQPPADGPPQTLSRSQVAPHPHLAPNAESINYVCSQAGQRPYSRQASGPRRADSTPSRGTDDIPALPTAATPTVCPVNVNLCARARTCV